MCKSSHVGDPAMNKTEWKSREPRFTLGILKSSDGHAIFPFGQSLGEQIALVPGAEVTYGWQTMLHLLMLSKHCFPSLAGCAGPHTPSGAADAVCNCWLDLATNPGSWHELPQTLLSLNQHDSTWRINNLQTEVSTCSCELGGWLLFEAVI